MSRFDFSSRRRRLALSIPLALAGCGGGGGGDLPAPAPAPSPAPSPAPAPTPAPPPAELPAWSTFGRDAQHAAQSAIASQDLARVVWSAPVDLQPQYRPNGSLLIHYGSPVISAHNTIAFMVKTGATGGLRIETRSAATGALLSSNNTDYRLPPADWTPSVNPVITPAGRLCYPGAGGKVYFMPVDGAAAPDFVHFAGRDVYGAAAGQFDAAVFINTPLTSDAQGNVYFGFQVTGVNPAGLVSGFARVTPDGQGRWVGAAAVAGDATIAKPATNSAPALSADGRTLYVAVNTAPQQGVTQTGALLALDSTTLALRARVALREPGGAPARVSDNGTSSPMVAPDGRVYFGVLEPVFGEHNGRGWLLQFDANLASAGAPGSFGWDITPSLVPLSMVPQYAGSAPYLIATKYNNYLGRGDGRNMLAVLDPFATQQDAFSVRQVMREVLTIVGPTPAPAGGVYEWCINTMAVDVPRRSLLVNSEDGVLYRWDLPANALAQSLRLTGGLGQAYTPTAIGPDGMVYAISDAKLFAVGR